MVLQQPPSILMVLEQPSSTPKPSVMMVHMLIPGECVITPYVLTVQALLAKEHALVQKWENVFMLLMEMVIVEA